MKAPDKLYVSQLIYETWQYQTPDPDDETQVEYIRKEALLEWAKGLYEMTMTFVSGDIERDNEIQKFALRISKHIESL